MNEYGVTDIVPYLTSTPSSSNSRVLSRNRQENASCEAPVSMKQTQCPRSKGSRVEEKDVISKG